MKASAKQAQDKASKALTEAELAKKKAQEEEEAKLAEERALEEEAQARAEAEAASTDAVAQESSVEEDASVAKADEVTEEIEAVAKQLDETAAGLDVAARDLGMMFAQAGGTAAAGTTAGISTTAIVAGVAVVGVAAAASDSDSSSPAASTGGSGSTSSSTFAAITPLVGAVDVNLTPTSALTSAITQSAVASVSGQASLTNLNRGTTFTNISAPTFVAGVYTAPAGDVNQSIAVTSATTSLGSGGVTINGGGGTDRVAASLSGPVTTAVTTNDVEVFAVTASSGFTGSVNTANFNGVRELWNSGSSVAVTFGNVESTETRIGVYNTTTATTVNYAADAEVGSVVTVSLERVSGSAAVTLNTSAVTSESTVSTVRVSSDGAAATGNTLVGLTGPTSAKTLSILGDTKLTLSGVSTSFETIDASGLKGNFALTNAALGATNATVIGGAGTANSFTGTISKSVTAVDLDLTRIHSATLTFANVDATVDLAGTTGLQTVAIVSATSATDPSFKGVEAGTKFTVGAAGAVAGTGTSTFAFRDLSDLNITASGANSVVFGGVTTEKVRNLILASSSTNSTTAFGNLTVGASEASVNEVRIANTGTATAAAAVTAGTITSAQSSPLVVNVATTDSFRAITTSNVSASKDLSVTLTGAKAAAQLGTLTSSDGNIVLVSSAKSAATQVGTVTAEKDIGVTVSGAAGTGVTASVGALTSYSGDVGAVITASASLGSSTARSGVSISNISAKEGSVGLKISSEGGALGTADANATTYGSLATAGNIEASSTVNIQIETSAGGGVGVANASGATQTRIQSTDGDVGISIKNGSSSSRQSEVSVGVSTAGTRFDIKADQDVALVVDNGVNGGVYVGNLSAERGSALINLKNAQDSTVTVGNIDADGAVTLGLSVGQDSTSNIIRDIDSGSGDVVVGVSAARGSITQVGALNAASKDVIIGKANVGTSTTANSGVVSTSLAQDAQLSLGQITAREIGGSLILGSSSDKIALGVNSGLTIAGVQTYESISITNLTLAANAEVAIGSGGLNSENGSVTIDLAPATTQSSLTFGGNIVAAERVEVDFKGAAGSRIVLGGASARAGDIELNLEVGERVGTIGLISLVGNVDATTGGSIDISASAGRGATISLADNAAQGIKAEGNVNITLVTGAATNGSGENDVGLISSASGDINLLATVNSSVGTGQSGNLDFTGSTATLGNILVDAETSVGAAGLLDLGNLTANGARSDGTGGSVTVDGVALAEGATLRLGTVGARANITVGADLSANAKLITSGLTSTAGTVFIDADNGSGVGSTGAVLTTGALAGYNGVSVEFVGASASDVNIGGNVTSSAGSVLLDLAVGATSLDINVDGNVEALGTGQTVTILASAGSGAEIDIADGAGEKIRAHSNITIDVSAGPLAGTSGNSDIATGGVESTAGDILLSVDVNATTAEQTRVKVGNATATAGNFTLTSDSFVATGGELRIGQVNANTSGKTVTIGTSNDAIALGGTADLTIGAVSASGAINLHATLAAGTSADLTGVTTTSLTSLAGSVTVVASGPTTASTKTSATALQNFTELNTGGVTASGNVAINFYGASGSAVTNSGLTSSAGAVNLVYQVGAESTISTGTISGRTGVDLDFDMGARVLAGGTITSTGITSTGGNVVANYNIGNLAAAAKTSTGAVLGSGLVDIDFAAGTNGNFDVTSITSNSGDIDVNVTVGANSLAAQADRIVIGQVEAKAHGKSIDFVLAAGANSDMMVAASSTISANGEVTFNLTTGAGSDNTIGNSGISSNNGDVKLTANVVSSTASPTTLTFGAITATEGDFSMFPASMVGANATVTFQNITTTGLSGSGRDINFGTRTPVTGQAPFGASYSRITLLDDAKLKTGQLTAENDIGIYAILREGATIGTNFIGETAKTVTSNNGSLRVMARNESLVGVLGDGEANTSLVIAANGESNLAQISTEDSVEIGFVGGLNSRVQVGHIDVFEGPVLLNLTVENSTTAGRVGILVGKIEATGDENNPAIGESYVNINAYAGTGNRILIANAENIVADDNVTIGVTVGEGLTDNTQKSYIATGTRGIVSNDGDITITAKVISSNSSNDRRSELTFGKLTAYDGNVEISGDSFVEPQGALTFGQIIAGNNSTDTTHDVRIGTLSNRVEVEFGGVVSNTTDQTSFETGNISADGDISGYFTMGDGALVKLGKLTSVNASVTVDIASANKLLSDTQLSSASEPNGKIQIGNISAATTASLKFVSSAESIDSPVMAVGNVVGTSGVNIVYKGANASQLSQAAGTLGSITTSGYLNATIGGSAKVDLTGTISASGMNIKALGLNAVTGGVAGNTSDDHTGELVVTGTSSADNFWVSSSNSTLTGGNGNDTYRVYAGDGGGTTKIIETGGGNDRYEISGGTGNIASDSSGDDTYVLSGGVNVIVDSGGSTGDDFDITGGVHTITTSGSGFDNFDVQSAQATIHADSAVDTFIIRTGSTVSLLGGDGADSLTVLGGTQVRGNMEAGSDTIVISGGLDNSVLGGAGADTINLSGSSSSTVDGGADNDTFVVSGGTNTVIGGAGDDSFGISAGTNSVFGGADADRINITGSSSNTIRGDSGTDTITVSAGTNTIDGGSGADSILVSGGTASVEGGADTDVIRITGGTVTLYGLHDGNDQLNISGSPSSVTTKLAGAYTAAANSSISVGYGNVEFDVQNHAINLGAMTSSGNNGVHIISLGTGAVNGSQGKDLIEASGSLSVQGNIGSDEFEINGGLMTITDLGLTAAGTYGTEKVVIGSAGSLKATGVVDFKASADSVNNGATVGSAEVNLAAAGRVDLSSVTSGRGWYVVGSTGAESITGSGLADTLNGGADADTIIGGAGNDTINGGDGGDRIDLSGAGAGNDYVLMTGASASGAVTFTDVVSNGGNVDDTDTFAGSFDVIVGFASGDTLDLPGNLTQDTGAIKAAGAVNLITAGEYALLRGTWTQGTTTFAVGAAGPDTLVLYHDGTNATNDGVILLGVTSYAGMVIA